MLSEETRRQTGVGGDECLAWVTQLEGTTSLSIHFTTEMGRFDSGKLAYKMLTTHPDWKPSLLLGQKEVRQEKEQQETPHTAKLVQKCEEEQVETGLSQPVKESLEKNMLDQ